MIHTALRITIALLIGTCVVPDEPKTPAVREIPEKTQTRPVHTQALHLVAEPVKVEPTDPYAGWQAWCEPHEWDRVCYEDQDCATVLDPGGFRTRCRQPRWSRREGSDVRVCMAPPNGRKRRDYYRAQQRVFVDRVCRPPRWWRRNQGMAVGSCWKHRRGQTCARRCNPEKLHRFLRVVALRESTWKPFVRHRLNPDVKAAKTAWARQAKVYGWHVRTDRKGGVQQIARLRGDANLFYRDRWRWMGLGLYGQNSPLWVAEWDPRAPPEVLCRIPEATEVYLRRARKVWRKIAGGIDCDRNGSAEFRGSGRRNGNPIPTWADIHQGASHGRLCPQSRSRRLFAARAGDVGLDPDEPIRLEHLGDQIPRDLQHMIADEIRDAMAKIEKP